MNNKKIIALRESGFVKRGHNCRIVGSEYNNAEHQWQCLALLYKLHPDPSRNLIWALTFHDVAERYFGDMPASVNWLRPELKKAQTQAERTANEALEVTFETSTIEEQWVHAIDRLELLLWVEDQLAFGNQHIANLATTVRQWFRDSWDQIPKPVQDFFSTYEWQRTSEIELP